MRTRVAPSGVVCVSRIVTGTFRQARYSFTLDVSQPETKSQSLYMSIFGWSFLLFPCSLLHVWIYTHEAGSDDSMPLTLCLFDNQLLSRTSCSHPHIATRTKFGNVILVGREQYDEHVKLYALSVLAVPAFEVAHHTVETPLMNNLSLITTSDSMRAEVCVLLGRASPLLFAMTGCQKKLDNKTRILRILNNQKCNYLQKWTNKSLYPWQTDRPVLRTDSME